jgi:hypothetical protein
MYKLAFIAAGGLFTAGAILGRAARRRSRHEMPDDSDGTRRAIGPGPWEAGTRAAREPDRVKRDPPRD